MIVQGSAIGYRNFIEDAPHRSIELIVAALLTIMTVVKGSVDARS